MLRPLTSRGVPATALGALVVALGVMHLSLDGLTGILIPLQPTLSATTGTDPAALGLRTDVTPSPRGSPNVRYSA